jgi:hypothetical protein
MGGNLISQTSLASFAAARHLTQNKVGDIITLMSSARTRGNYSVPKNGSQLGWGTSNLKRYSNLKVET